MRWITVLLLLESGCINFDAIEADACNLRGLCGPDSGSTGMDASVTRFCQPCKTSSECGGGENLCFPNERAAQIACAVGHP